MKKLPKYLYRSDDGERWTLQSNGKYWMDNSNMPKDFKEYYSSYAYLIACGFVVSLSECDLQANKIMTDNDGHGNGDFDE